MKSSEIRKKFLDFFASKGHTIVASDTLIPKGDPTLLFTTAGMVQFKPLYAGAPLVYPRAASCQKCLRAGGKGSDLENVGRTLRHHTFFEMLGNFSFGDYFKQEAIHWAWEFLSDVLHLKSDKIWVSVFRDDEEAFQIWMKDVGFPHERIVRLGEKDNFWGPAGDTGACGPSSEIYFDLGAQNGCGKMHCQPGCDCERYIEIWNLVFPQFDQQLDGTRLTLARRGIDTGMGLERITFVSEGTRNNYQTDLFRPLIEEIEKISPKSYSPETQMAYHVIADHARSLTFAIGDQVIASNEGRGYVLRRILRRASRFAGKLDIKGPMLYRLVGVVADLMKDVYPELMKTRDSTARTVKFEEERFLGTVSFGLNVLEDLMKTSDHKILSGEELFRLYDTFGFPLDMAKEVADEEGFQIDEAGFQKFMAEQKEKSRSSWVGKNEVEKVVAIEELKAKCGGTEFLGYQLTSCDAKILAILSNSVQVPEAKVGDSVQLILNRTPFYGESGGQIGDRGKIQTAGAWIEISNAEWPIEGITLHHGVVKYGVVKSGEEVFCQVDPHLRLATARHHSATHLLHYALRRILGDHVRQAGSLVSPDKLRFDFSHFSKVTQQDLDHIESLINEKIVANVPIMTTVVPIEEAKSAGALMFFGDKYGSIVRMLNIGGFSIELCGGTHVQSTGELGLFRVTSESSVASGIRRMEALSGLKAYDSVKSASQTILDVCSKLGVSSEDLVIRVEKILSEQKRMEKEIASRQVSNAKSEIEKILSNPQKIHEKTLYMGQLKNLEAEPVRQLMDYARSKVSSGVILLISTLSDRVVLLCAVTPDLIQSGVHAGKIVQALAKVMGGGGGGKPDFAQAGGKDPSKLQSALDLLPELLR